LEVKGKNKEKIWRLKAKTAHQDSKTDVLHGGGDICFGRGGVIKFFYSIW
jgi:hypothetical protein